MFCKVLYYICVKIRRFEIVPKFGDIDAAKYMHTHIYSHSGSVFITLDLCKRTD